MRQDLEKVVRALFYLSEPGQGDLFTEPTSIKAGINAFKLLVLLAVWLHITCEF